MTIESPTIKTKETQCETPVDQAGSGDNRDSNQPEPQTEEKLVLHYCQFYPSQIQIQIQIYIVNVIFLKDKFSNTRFSMIITPGSH